MTTVPNAPTGKTAHVDTFCRDHLPPRELWPVMDYALPELAYPPQLNCATELLDRNVENGDGDRTAFLFPGGRWTYRDVLEMSNRIAHVLISDLGIVPGNRVLLRGPNSPMMAACWFAVVKVGAVVVCTMPLLRVRELTYIADKAEISLALCDARFGAECEAAMQQSGAGKPRAGARTVHFASNEPGSLERMMAGKPVTFTNCMTAADDTVLI
ncbi:MAG TPA: AMP-binding protein, partial [Gemmatimonadaceae bacterium]|nr:AMP-binding protein [Gemmatimonadaceae bacterium]